jgi:drug/metabolite transporter (DMT)-like permease
MKLRWVVLAGLSVFWGSEWLLTMELVDVPHFRMLALRYLIAALVLVPWLIRNRRELSGRLVLRNAALSVVLIILPAIFLGSRPNLSPGLLVLLFAMLPMICAILEDGNWMAYAPLLLGALAGTAFLVRSGLSFDLSQALPVAGLLPMIMATAFLLIRAKAWLGLGSLASHVAIQGFTAVVVLGVYSLVSERDSFTLSLAEGFSLICLGVLSGVSYVGFYWLIRSGSASRTTVVQWTIPAVSIAGTAVWLRHLPTWDTMLGGAACLVCAGLFFRSAGSEETLTLQITEELNR